MLTLHTCDKIIEDPPKENDSLPLSTGLHLGVHIEQMILWLASFWI